MERTTTLTLESLTPVIKSQVAVTVDNIDYLHGVAKRVIDEPMAFSPVMVDTDDDSRVIVNVENLSKDPDDRSIYSVAFVDDIAVSCTCKADKHFNTCKHRVSAQRHLAPLTRPESPVSEDGEGVPLNRYDGQDTTTGTVTDALENLRTIKSA